MTVTTIQTGQWSAALGCAAAAAWWAARRQSWAVCGGWLGFIGAFKPFVVPVALWVLLEPSRARRAMAPMIAGVAIPFVAGLVVFGVDAHLVWLNQAGNVHWLWTPWSVSLHGLLARWSAPDPFGPLPTLSPLVSALGWVGGAVIITASLWRVRHADVDRAFGLLWVSSLLAFPLGWVYYGWLAFSPVVALVAARRVAQPLARTAVVMLAYPPALLWLGTERPWIVTIGSVYFWATALLWLAIWMDRTGDPTR